MAAVTQAVLLAGKGSALYTESSATPGESNLGAGFTMFCRSFAVDNDATVTSVGIYSGTAGAMKVKIALRNSSTSYTVVVSEAVTHGGAGWQDFTLSSPYVVPSSGTYHAGLYQNLGVISSVASQARTFKNSDVGLTTDTGMTEDTGSGPGVRVTGTTPA